MDNASARAQRDGSRRGDSARRASAETKASAKRWQRESGERATVGRCAIAPPPGAEKKWYIVNTYSGHENKAKLTLLERVEDAQPHRVLR